MRAGGYNQVDGTLLHKTGARIDIYVAASVGTDTNPGTAAAPLATVAEAIRRLDYFALISPGAPGAIIHVGSGTYQFTEPVGPILLAGPIFIIGDGGGQGGDDGFTQLVAPAGAVAGSGTGVLVSGGGFTVNQYRGKTLQILSGSANGDNRTIRSNTATDFIPASNFSAAVAATNSYRIVEPAVIFEFELASATVPNSADLISLARNIGAESTSVLHNSTGDGAVAAPAVYYVNVRLKTKAGDADPFASPTILSSTVAFFGCEFFADAGKFLIPVFDKASLVMAGTDYTGISGQAAIRPFEAALATGRRSWAGWGIASFGTGTVSFNGFSRLEGFVALSHGVSLQDAEWRLYGGSIITTGGAAVDCLRWSKFITGTASSPNVLLRCEQNAAVSATIFIRSGAQVEFLSGTTIEKANQGFCIFVGSENSGQGEIIGQVGIAAISLTGETASTAPTGAVSVFAYGVAILKATPTFTGFTTGTQLQIHKATPTGTLIQQADFSELAAGESIPSLPMDMRFVATGVLAAFSDGTPGTFTQAASFDGIFELSRVSLWDTIRLTQMVDGTVGTTTVEIFRRRGGTNTSLGTISLNQGGGAFAQASLTPASTALRALAVADLIMVQFNARQTNGAFAIVEFLGGGVDQRFGLIMRV